MIQLACEHSCPVARFDPVNHAQEALNWALCYWRGRRQQLSAGQLGKELKRAGTTARPQNRFRGCNVAKSRWLMGRMTREVH